jgi:Tol biopolymer transport system component
MTLEAGQSIGPYQVTASLGAGGMGEVYRATDTNLNREVAIKVLPDDFAGDGDRLSRFQREAHLLAALNHPNIAAIYGLEHFGDRQCLILELVEGLTLAERLADGQMPVDETLQIAGQMAGALEAAHEKGIIHRDLKPENVKITPDGMVKVLDFGLAKAEPAPGVDSRVNLSRSPTVPLAETRDGVILGTVPFMSPEQARGRPVDKRTDIWSLGCVVYECLTGRRVFQGATTTDVLAQIVTHEPDFDLLPAGTPAVLVALLRRCLVKDPRRRLRDAGEFRIAVEEHESGRDSGITPVPSAHRPRSAARQLFPLWVLVIVLVAALAWSLAGRRPAPAQNPTVTARWSIPLPLATRLGLPGPGGRFDYSSLVAISADGERIAYTAQGWERSVEVYVRSMDAVQPQRIQGATNGRGLFFSPDGEWLGFLSSETIQKVALSGGAPQTICEIGRVVSFDASWSPDGETIVFATDDGLWQVSAEGGQPLQLTEPDAVKKEVGHHTPWFLPDGSGVLFTVSETPETHLALLSLATNAWEIIARNAAQGILLGRDRLVFARAGEILAAPFDLGEGRMTGPAATVLQGVHTSPGLGGVVLTHYDISATGTLVFIPAGTTEEEDQLLWVDHDGKETLITSGPGTWVHPRLSPDGRRVSLDIHSPQGMRDVHIYDLERGLDRHLTSNGISWESAWRPDGQQIAVMSGAPAGRWSLFVAPTDFSGPPELLMQQDYAVPAQWLASGEALLYTDLGGGVWKLPLTGAGDQRIPEKILGSSGRERHAILSSDQRWMAYTADEGGHRQVFVQSFPEPGPKHQVSIAGGGEPVWSPDGRHLYFRDQDQMLVSDISYGPFTAGPPRLLFKGEYDAAPRTGHQHYDISLDGKLFLMVKHGEAAGPDEVQVVLNWLPEMKSAEAAR